MPFMERLHSSYLIWLKNAFDAIDAGIASFEESDGADEYQFEGFSIIAPKQR